MKLTDESVAKALGWKRVKGTVKGFWAWEGPDGVRHSAPWHFTTSLDAIVAEIKSRKLQWDYNDDERQQAYVYKHGNGCEGKGSCPAEALCAALLAYLKEA